MFPEEPVKAPLYFLFRRPVGFDDGAFKSGHTSWNFGLANTILRVLESPVAFLER
jgi:hypothetical protein